MIQKDNIHKDTQLDCFVTYYKPVQKERIELEQEEISHIITLKDMALAVLSSVGIFILFGVLLSILYIWGGVE